MYILVILFFKVFVYQEYYFIFLYIKKWEKTCSLFHGIIQIIQNACTKLNELIH